MTRNVLAISLCLLLAASVLSCRREHVPKGVVVAVDSVFRD